MKGKKDIAYYFIIFGGLLVVLWGLLHILIISVVSTELTSSGVDAEIVSLITLSYVGVVIMISLSGLTIILADIYGIKKEEKWAYYVELSQGILYGIVTLLLATMQPRVSVIGFSADLILILAITTDACISAFILVPLVILYKDFF